MARHLPLATSPLRLRADLRVLLINPPQSYPQLVAREYQSYFPAGLASLGASVEASGASVRLVDCLSDPRVRRSSGLVWFGMGLRPLRDEIARFRPHVVGVCNPFSMFVDDAALVGSIVKDVDSKIAVVMGGVEASLAPNNRRLLEEKAQIDILVKGEGELTLTELLSRYQIARGTFADLATVQGILYRDETGSVQETPDRPWVRPLDQLPPPAYHLLDMQRMFDNPFYARYRGRQADRRCIPVHTSRGCPYSCNFCSVHSQVGKSHRRHSSSEVVKHIAFLKASYGVEHFHFEDDNLTLHAAATAELFDALEPMGITFDTPNGIRADTVSPELASRLRRAGARSLTIAVESGVQRILDEVIDKALDLKAVLQAAGTLDREDVPCVAFFVIGFPGETEQDVRETLRFAREMALRHGTINLLFVANPLPGTPLFRQCVDNGYLVKEPSKETLFAGIRLNRAGLVETNEFSKRDLFHWAREELDREGLLSCGFSIPFFFADSQRGVDRAARWMGLSSPGMRQMRRYPWSEGFQPNI